MQAVQLFIMLAAALAACLGGVTAAVPTVWSAHLPATPQAPPPPRHTLYADPASVTSGLYLGGGSVYGLSFKDGSTTFGPVGSKGQYFSRAVVPMVDGEAYFVVVNSSHNAQGQVSVTGFNAATGGVVWSTPASFTSMLALDKEHGVVHTQVPVDTAIGLDARTGTQVSSVQLGSGSTILGAAGGQLLVLTNRGKLRSISATSGAQSWSLASAISTANSATCVIEGGVWYIAGQQSAFAGAGAVFVAVNAASGTQVFTRTFASPVASAPVVRDGVVFAGISLYANDNKGSVVALDASTGHTLWLYNATTVVGRNVACDGDSVYLTTSPSRDFGEPVFNLVALEAATGSQRWSYQLPTTGLPTGSLSNFEVSQPLALQWGGLVLVSLYDGNGDASAVVYAVSNSTATAVAV